MRQTARRASLIAVAALALLHTSCVSDVSLFTDNRLEDPCNSSIPICDTQAACVLEGDEYYRSEFPGGTRLIVRTETEQSPLFVRFLLTDPIFPGTELQVIAYDPGCGEFDEEHPRDIDLFELAGDDRIIEFELELNGRGDHLVEIFSDMSSQYLFGIILEEQLP